MNKKQVIRINENQLRQIVTESVKRILNESIQYQLVDNLKEMIGAMLNRCYKYPQGGGTILQSDVDEIYQMAKQLYSSTKTRETYKILKNIEEMAKNGNVGSYKLVEISEMLDAI